MGTNTRSYLNGYFWSYSALLKVSELCSLLGAASVIYILKKYFKYLGGGRTSGQQKTETKQILT